MNHLVVLLGPTGVGKTESAMELAEFLDSPIVSSDSRQIYKEIPIGTAAPTIEQIERVKHYMVGFLSVSDYYSASKFEEDVLTLLKRLFANGHQSVLMTGGSMMYIDAVCKGIDDIPTVKDEIRKAVYDDYNRNGLEVMLQELKQSDLIHYDEVDRNNYKRVLHAIEICRQTGKPYSSFRTNKSKKRPFNIIKVGLNREREELCERINKRVDAMMSQGLLEEAHAAYPYRNLNSLNTVGYKELFKYFDGEWTLDFAVDKIKRNSRVYARKQMTWFKRDETIKWFHPDAIQEIKKYVESCILNE